MNQIATAKVILEQSRQWKYFLLICFFDYAKAFDSCDWECMWNLMRHHRIHSRYLILVMMSYIGMWMNVALEGRLTKSFEIYIKVLDKAAYLRPFYFF